MEKELKDMLPIMGVEHDCILSFQGDVTVVYELILPELFTLSDSDYEALHQAWVKAIKVLPKQSVLHKQDWFTEATYQGNFLKEETSFLSHASERFFQERPYLEHRCYLMLTKKPGGRKPSTSLFSSLLKRSIVPGETLSKQSVQEFLDSCSQLERILSDSGFVQLKRMKEEELISSQKRAGLIERYCMLLDSEDELLLRDISFGQELQIGNAHLQLYTLSDAQDLPAYCGPRINYDRYSTDKSKFSVGFAAPLGQLLSCNHIYNQYVL
jgi:conjugation system TraG family ATPase